MLLKKNVIQHTISHLSCMLSNNYKENRYKSSKHMINPEHIEQTTPQHFPGIKCILKYAHIEIFALIQKYTVRYMHVYNPHKTCFACKHKIPKHFCLCLDAIFLHYGGRGWYQAHKVSACVIFPLHIFHFCAEIRLH